MEKENKKQEVKKPEAKKEEYGEMLIRILATDMPVNKGIYPALTKVKGISWTFANAICTKLGFAKSKKVGELSEKEIAMLTEFVKNPQLPKFILNRRKDFDEGKDSHLIGTDLDLRKEFDIKRLKKIKCYRGIRHTTGQPCRGQRTKSHFRKNKTLGVTSRKKK